MTAVTQAIQTSRRYRLISATIAMLLWGGWACYVNAQAGGWGRGLVSGLVQGISSFVITLVMAWLIARGFACFQAKWAKLLLPPVLTILLTGGFLVGVHSLVGTPSIGKTLAPVLTVAFVYGVLTHYKLYQLARQRSSNM